MDASVVDQTWRYDEGIVDGVPGLLLLVGSTNNIIIYDCHGFY